MENAKLRGNGGQVASKSVRLSVNQERLTEYGGN